MTKVIFLGFQPCSHGLIRLIAGSNVHHTCDMGTIFLEKGGENARKGYNSMRRIMRKNANRFPRQGKCFGKPKHIRFLHSILPKSTMVLCAIVLVLTSLLLLHGTNSLIIEGSTVRPWFKKGYSEKPVPSKILVVHRRKVIGTVTRGKCKSIVSHLSS